MFSEGGATAQAIASERPSTPVIAFTPFQRTVQRLALVWGVSAYRALRTRTSHEMTLEGERILFEEKLVQPGEHFVVVVGASRQQGLTNIMHIRTMSKLGLVRPVKGAKSAKSGKSTKPAAKPKTSRGGKSGRKTGWVENASESEGS